MSIERVASSHAGLAEVLDRVLVGIDLVIVEARVVVASIATYREQWDEPRTALTGGRVASARPPRRSIAA